MRRICRIPDGFRDFILVRRFDATPEELKDALPPGYVSGRLRVILGPLSPAHSVRGPVDTSGLKVRLLEMCRELGAAGLPPSSTRVIPAWLLDRIGAALLAGRLVGVRLTSPTGMGIGAPEAPEAGAPVLEAPEEEKVETTWIELELKDQNGDPVPHEAYELVLADGTVRKGRVDKQGFARVEGIVPGTCKVTWKGYDGTEWRRA